MSITTMESLEAVPVGGAIRVQGVREWLWNRTDRGWERDGVVLESAMFAGHVAAGQVSGAEANTPAAGEWWQDTHHLYLVTGIEDGTVTAILFSPGNPWLHPAYRLQLRSFRRQVVTPAVPERVKEICTPHHLRLLGEQVLVARQDVEKMAQEVQSRPDPAVMKEQVRQVAVAAAQATASLQQATQVLQQLQAD